MQLPLFEDPIPPEFQNYHFMIRGWTPRTGERRSTFDIFLKEIAADLPLKTEEVVVRDEEVAFVRLGSTTGANIPKENIKRLCRRITNPSKRNHIDKVTTRSLLGISPVGDHTFMCWVEAIFKAALDNGPQYLKNMEVKGDDHIPGWAIVLSFAMIAGINITGYQVTQLRDQKNTSAWTVANINNKMIELFGSGGVSAGGSFLKKVTLGNEHAPDLEELRNSYRLAMSTVEDNIETTFHRIKDIRDMTRRKNKKDLSMSCRQAVSACYDSTLLAAQAMLTDENILETYLTARMKETESIGLTQGIATVAFLTNAAMACEVVAAPWSFAAIGTWFSAGAWPTVLTVTNPAGLAMSAVGLAILGVSMFVNSQRKEEILRHQNLSILISRSCNVINEASILLMCTYHLDSDHLDSGKRKGTADQYLEHVGNEDFLQHWRAFVKEDEEKRGRRRRNRSSAQRQVFRYIRELTKEQESKLRACLDRFRETGELDPSMSEGSSGEGSDVVSGDD